MFFYVYVLESDVKGDWYVGFTTDLRRRAEEHNKGQNRSTKSRSSWQVIYYEAHANKLDALRREKYLKTTPGRRALRRMLREYINEERVQVESLLLGTPSSK